ncbi:MAG: M24 family metallopeptidase [Sedimentisphaeraceae bacterium JB056]
MTIKEAIKERVRNIRKKIKAEGFDAVLLTSKENVTYTTGFSGDDSWVLLNNRKVWLITDSRYIEQAQIECDCTIINRSGAMDKEIAKIAAKNKSIKKIATEGSLKVALYNTLDEELKVKFEPVTNIIGNLRQYKDDYEIACIKKAASIAKKVLKDAFAQIRAGISESEFAGLIEFEMRKRAVVPAFETIVAFGANGSRPHHIPGKGKLRKNDTILIDYGVKYKGYCCDITRCFTVGKPSKDYIEAYNCVLEAQAAAIKAVKAGAKMSDVDISAREVIDDAGLPDFGHGTGHGFGLYIHEPPTIYKLNETLLEAGQVITIEPGVYIPGKLGIRIEDDVLVTETGYKLLTRSRKSPELETIEINN